MENDFYTRNCLLKCNQSRRQDFRSGRWRIADVQFSVFTTSQSTGSGGRFFGALQDGASFFQEKFSFGSERHTTRTAAEQVHADFVFQVLHLAAQCGLGDAKFRGGLVEAQGFANDTKYRK